MLKKTYGLVYRRGKWFSKNYRRELKKGGMTWGNAKILAWWRNRKGETPPIKINLKRKRFKEASDPPALKPGDLVAFRDANPFIKVIRDDPRP